MSLLLRIAFVALVTFGLYSIAHRALYLPDKHALSALRNPHGKPSFDEELSRALRSVTNLISRLFPMSEYKRLRYETDLARLGIATTPQDFVSNAMAKSAMFAIIGIAFIPLGIPWLALLTCVAGILSYFRTTQQLRKKIEALNREVDAELPRMVGMMECTLGDSRDLITFFSRYRKTAGVALGHELDKLLIDMQTGNQEQALRRMAARVQSNNLSALVTILCGVNQGSDQRTSLSMLAQDVRAQERELLRRKMTKAPARIKIACFILTILMILMFMVPLIMMIIDTLSGVGF